MKHLFTIILITLGVLSMAQTTQVVRPGKNNLPITEMKFEHNGTTYTQTSEASGTIANTNLAVSLSHIKVNDNGTIYTLHEFNNEGAIIINNNFSVSTSGVGVYDRGTTTSAVDSADWEAAMVGSGTSNNLLNYLYYDGVSSVPSGADFDILWTRGWDTFEYLVVGERNGNTCFSLEPIDSSGQVITTANILQFGNCYGSNLQEYDWNTGYAPGNYNNQPFVFTVAKMSEFNTASTIYGFRIDNTGNADPKFFGMSDQPFSGNPINPMIPGIAGNLFHDANGLNNNTVDGTAIYNPANKTIYANLIDSSGIVVKTMAIAADGSYSFFNLAAGTYSVVMSTTEGVVGGNAPSPSLPSDWLFVGENIGANSGSDGTVDGVVSGIVLNSKFVFEANVGIEVAPVADDKSETITTPVYNSTLLLTTSNSFPQLSGSDYEDGTLGSGSTLVISDSSGMSGNKLYYDGESVVLNTPIANFNAALLSVKFTGYNSTSFSFSYFFKDSASADANVPADYIITWGSPLPVDWLSFTAKLDPTNQKVIVEWSTAQEVNNSHFNVLRASGSNTFEVIGTIAGKGFYTGISEYAFHDESAKLGDSYTYMVQQVDFDGNNSHTNAVIVDLTRINQLKLEVYPNPFSTTLRLNFNKNQPQKLSVTDFSGKILMYESNLNERQLIEINTVGWVKGVYFILVEGQSTTKTFKVIKN